MGRHPGFTLTKQQKQNVRDGIARARARRYREQGQENKPKRKYTHRAKSEATIIAPPAFSAPAVAPDMHRAPSPNTKLARLRSLDAQATDLLQRFIAFRRQVTQLAQEEEV